MNYPNRIMKIIGFLLFLTLLFLSTTMKAGDTDQISLTSIKKQESLSRTRLTLYFSDLPKFETSHSGQRVDLLLSDTLPSAKLHNLPEDETVMKILLAQKPRDLMVSVLLRRPPMQVETETLRNPARIRKKSIQSRTGSSFRNVI